MAAAHGAWRHPQSGEPAAKRRLPIATGRCCMKILLSAVEAAFLRKQNSKALQEVRQTNGADIALGSPGVCYPGSALEECNIQGTSSQVVFAAAVHALSLISDTLKKLHSDCGDVETGGARVKMVVPVRVVPTILQETAEQLREQAGISIIVDPATVPPGQKDELTEQAIALHGPITGVQLAVAAINTHLANLVHEPWFANWATCSNTGVVVPGMVLFADTPCKAAIPVGPGTGHWPATADGTGCLADGRSSAPPPPNAPVTMKLLLEPSEASLVDIASVESQSTTDLTLSGMRLYPGTSLQELCIQGASEEAVLKATNLTLGAIADAKGSITCGEVGVESGGSRVKIVLPIRAAKALIGVQGATVSRIRQQSHMHVHIEQNHVPPGPPTQYTEQVVSVSGPVSGLALALAMISQVVSQYFQERWYAAWTGHSHAGLDIPGLSLFEDHKSMNRGKSNREQRVNMKTVDPVITAYTQAMAAAMGVAQPVTAPTLMAMKALVSTAEASLILGKGGLALRDIGQTTFTKISLSDRTRIYPGTMMQELVVMGFNMETVVSALMLSLAQVSIATGSIAGGEENIAPGECRVKLIVPAGAAKVIIGRGGENVKQLREQSTMQVHVEETLVPPGPANEASEQVVSLAGPIMGLQVALPMVGTFIAETTNEPWFPVWATTSHAGLLLPGFQLFGNRRNFKGKGKGMEMGLEMLPRGGGSPTRMPGYEWEVPMAPPEAMGRQPFGPPDPAFMTNPMPMMPRGAQW